jgi:hypothetical protein
VKRVAITRTIFFFQMKQTTASFDVLLRHPVGSVLTLYAPLTALSVLLQVTNGVSFKP